MRPLTRAELHRLIDDLPESELATAGRVLAALRALAAAAEPPIATAAAEASPARAEPMTPDQVFFVDAPRTADDLASEQGGKPIADPKALRGAFWPKGEEIDEFIEAVREWRREGGYA